MAALVAVLTLSLDCAGAADPSSAPAWVVDPRSPGADLPPAGRSLFDFALGPGEGAMPFPFTALVERIARGVQGDARSGASGTRAVLIPLGRSLQRAAGAPDFFRYPRVVVAVDGEPATQGAARGLLLKDRLYLGYQEKANLIEVISYNEAAARFEFQLVKDYGQGLRPRVVYADRAVCMSCHQNGAPIFSRPTWDETNANPRVAALLKRERAEFYGVRVERGVDLPNAIDDATDRANGFALSQRLWREGCGGNEPEALACRAALFKAVLQYRLSANRQFARSPAYREAVSRVARNAQARWPNGLAVGNPDLPNRSPVAERASLPAVGAESVAWSNVAAGFDPLVPRPPLAVWRADRPEHVDALVAGLAEFLAAPDLARLDAHLARTATGKAPTASVSSTCRISHRAQDHGEARLDLACSGNLAVEGRLLVRGDRVLRGTLDRVLLPAAGALSDIGVAASRLSAAREGRQVRLALAHNGRAPRGADGDGVPELRLTLPASDALPATAEAIVVRDFAPVEAAIAAMLADALAGRMDGFSDAPFRRARLMPALEARLGIKTGAWCCLDARALPAAAVEPTQSAARGPPALRPFLTHCAVCHQTAERTPPNFLRGEEARVRGQVEHCAERIYVRLAMWNEAPAGRVKSPMPPELAVIARGIDLDRWRAESELAALVAHAAGVLQARTGKPPRLDELLARGYEALPACLANLPAEEKRTP